MDFLDHGDINATKAIRLGQSMEPKVEWQFPGFLQIGLLNGILASEWTGRRDPRPGPVGE